MNTAKILELRKLFLEKGETVGEVEDTSGNYDNRGNLIEDEIPTITTEFCEIGVYNETIYFTFVIHSDSYNIKLTELLKQISNFKIYCLKNFLENIDIKSENFEEKIKKEKYFQINFEYPVYEDSNYLFDRYSEIKKSILDSNIKIVNQLEVDLTKK